MAKKHGEYLANDPDYVPDPEIEEFMEQEISRAPKDPELLAHRLRNNTAASTSVTAPPLIRHSGGIARQISNCRRFSISPSRPN